MGECMCTTAIYVALKTRLTASAGPDIGSGSPPPDKPACGPAQRAYPLPMDAGPALLPALRLALLTEARRARNLRQSRLAAMIEADLRSVTHQILRRGASSETMNGDDRGVR